MGRSLALLQRIYVRPATRANIFQNFANNTKTRFVGTAAVWKQDELCHLVSFIRVYNTVTLTNFVLTPPDSILSAFQEPVSETC